MVQYRHDTNVIIGRERLDLAHFSRLSRPRGMLGGWEEGVGSGTSGTGPLGTPGNLRLKSRTGYSDFVARYVNTFWLVMHYPLR